jgi:hypothetical protein
MAHDLDVYQDCPCGSGKKLKFCCAGIAEDMVKIMNMQAHHQYQMALNALDAVEKKPIRDAWSRAWVKTTRAAMLIGVKQAPEARAVLQEVLAELPEHPFAVALNALVTLTTEMYPASMRAVYKAYRHSMERYPTLVAQVTYTLANLLAIKGHLLAARQHFVMAVGLKPDDEEFVETLIEFEHNFSVPYPLRSEYALNPFAGPDSQRELYDAASKLAAEGCFSDAAKAFGQMARQEPNNAGLWWNIALCHAWAGEDPLATEAFRAAAANEADFEAAVDCQVLARLLAAGSSTSKVERLSSEYRVQSTSKLLTLLDGHEHFLRAPVSPEDLDEEDEVPAAVYLLLDRNPREVPDDQLTLDNLAREIGQIVIYDAGDEPDAKPQAFVSAMAGEHFERVNREFTEAAGGDVERLVESKPASSISAEILPLTFDGYVPPTCSATKRRQLDKARWQRVIHDIWPTVRQEALGNRSPQEAAALPELRAALAAAIVVLDIFCDRAGYPLDQDAVRSRLGLPEVQLIVPGEERDVSHFSILQIRRIAFGQLSDDQLMKITNRVARIGHRDLLYRAYNELLSRPALAEKVETPRIHMALANLSRQRLNREEALAWLAKGKQEARARQYPFEQLVTWELEELMLRDEEPGDPQIAELANRLWTYYVPKLPEFRDVIITLLSEISLPGPWQGAAVTGPQGEQLAAGAASSGGLWTPEAQTAGQPSKLWLPGS